MSGAELSTALRVLGAIAKPATDKLKRQEGVVAVLHKLGMAPDAPPPDFAGVYTYTVVEYCYGKPEPVLRLFQNQYVREAFERSFVTGDPAHLDREVAEILQWNEETGALGRLDYNLAREVTGFSIVFNRLVDRTRTAAETRMELGVNDIQETLAGLIRRIDRMGTREEILRQEGGAITSIRHLANELREWFAAVEYRILREVESGPAEFVWLVRVPARRGYDTAVVLGKSGELSAPDVTRAAELVTAHHASEGWVVVPQRISKAARAVDEQLEQVYCYTLDELIDESADFEPYLKWLEREVRDRQIDERFVPPSCVKDEPDRGSGRIAARSVYSWREGGLGEYVRSWLDDDTKEHLSILGEFGMGKSWFSLHFAWTVAQEWRAAKASGRKRPRLPLVIPLRDYAKAVSLESLFSEFFFRKHEILPGGYGVFEALNRMGRLLLIFDGFDEMAARVDRQAMINNFWELARAVVPGSKVLLTCRTEHFPEAREGRDVLSARLAASTQALTGEPPQFEVVELEPFDDDQVDELLDKLTSGPAKDVILQNQDLVDLIRRPVMADLVLSALPAIERGAKVDISRVYLYAVQHKIDADIRAERTFTSLADKVYFLCELSAYMLKESILSINYRAIPDHIRACFGPAVQEQRDLDHWHYDMLGQTMLVRNSEGDYSPAHRSLLEFFAAYRMAAKLGVMNEDFMTLIGSARPTGEPRFTWSELPSIPADERAAAIGWRPEGLQQLADSAFSVETPAVFDLMSPMLTTNPIESLVEYLRCTAELSDNNEGLLGANLIEIIARIDPNALRGRQLDGVDLRAAQLDRFDAGMSLAGCSLRGARFEYADLEDVDLAGADLTGARFATADYLGVERGAVNSLGSRDDLPVVCLTRDNRIYLWTLAGAPELILKAPGKVDGGVMFDDGKTLVVYGDDTTASRLASVIHDPATGTVSPHPIRGSTGDAWQIGEKHYLLELLQHENGELLTLRDIDTDVLTAEVLLDAANMTFEVNGVGRVFGLNVLSVDQDETVPTSEVEVFELLVGAGGDLRYEPHRTLRVRTADADNIQLYGASGVGVITISDDGLRLMLLDVDTGSLRLIDFLDASAKPYNRSLDYPARSLRAFKLSRDGSAAAVPYAGGVRVFRVDEPARPILEIDPDRHATSFTFTDRGLLVVADAYGGLSAYDLDTCAEVATANLSTKVRGAIFREATGLPQAVRDHLARNGAIVE
ncbi:NACHT domain-containing protein [Micromonospora sp. NPDC049171]|uniref:NACHT domain-containing protein n=1 Tax=Micromonospora sp. NPDC049171 TaxID=3155770 RepID=UPI0033E17E7E